MANFHTHQLAAIMFSDIVGYTALMGRDEEKGLELLKRNREIQKPLIEKYHGVWIKEMGDGVLAKFDSAYDALKCAMEIQQTACRTLKGLLRIGLHLGEIIIENDDIFGDGVNIASRIESITIPGGIFISEPFRKALRSKSDVLTNYLGEVSLKNVDDPVGIFYVIGENIVAPGRKKINAIRKGKGQEGRGIKKFFQSSLFYIFLILLLVGLLTWKYWYNNRPDRKVRAIAVLPFSNLTGDQNAQPIIDMMHDAITGEISKIHELKVISRTSTLQFKDTKLAVPVIAKKLNVDALIESSVLKTGDSIFMQVQLIKARPNEEHIGAWEYKRDARYIYSLYGDIAKSLADEVEISLTPKEKEKLTNNQPINPQVYKTYLEGRYHLLNLSKGGIEKSKEYFELVLEMEPDHVLAHAGLSMFYVAYAQQGHISFFEAGPPSNYHARRALEANIQLPEVYQAAAWNAWLHWELYDYLPYFRKALELDPNFSDVLAFMGNALIIEDEMEEALQTVRKAVELDPLNDTNKALYGMCLYFTDQFDEGLQFLSEALKKNPDHVFLNSAMRAVYHAKGMYQEEFESWIKKYVASGDTLAVQNLKMGYEHGGYEKALEYLTKYLIKNFNYTPEYVSVWQIATLYTRIGKKDDALLWLEKAYDLHSISLPFILIDPLFDSIREDKRFIELVEKLNLNRQ